jgi:hypothetical protein
MLMIVWIDEPVQKSVLLLRVDSPSTNKRDVVGVPAAEPAVDLLVGQDTFASKTARELTPYYCRYFFERMEWLIDE